MMAKHNVFTPEFQRVLDLAKESNTDIHTASASIMFNVDIKDVTKEMRVRSKEINFIAAYTQSGRMSSKSQNVANIPKSKENDQD